MLNVDKLRNDIKLENPERFIEFVLNVYTGSGDLNVNTNNGRQLRRLFNIDENNAGEVNLDDKNNFLNKRLIMDFMHKNGLWEQYKALPAGEEKNKINVDSCMYVGKEINLVDNYYIIDSSKLLKGVEQGTFSHEFAISVTAENLFKVARKIYELGRDNGIDFYMVLPALNTVPGVTDHILLNCSTDNLEGTLRLLDMVPEETKALCGQPSSFGAVVDGWLCYQSQDLASNMSMSAVVGSAFMTGVDTALLEIYKGLEVDADTDMWLQEFVNAEPQDKDKIRIELLNRLRTMDEGLFDSIVPYIARVMEESNVNLTHMFLSSDVAAELMTTYGSIQPVETEFTPVDENSVETIPVESLFASETVIPVQGAELNFEGLEEKHEEEVNFNFEGVNPTTKPVEVPASEGDSFPDPSEETIVGPNEALINPKNREVYNSIGITDELLDSNVTNERLMVVTLFQFLEMNRVLEKVPVDSKVICSADFAGHASGDAMRGADFIKEAIVPYALRVGETSVDEIINRYADDVVEEEVKKGFFGKLFGSK